LNRSIKTCVRYDGSFIFGIHKPNYKVINRRLNKTITELGRTEHGEIIQNHVNFPDGDLEITAAQPIYEIPNAFPFWGTTYILGDVASKVVNEPFPVSFAPKGKTDFEIWDDFKKVSLKDVPRPIVLAMAQTCTNPNILVSLLPLAAQFVEDKDGTVVGLRYDKMKDGSVRPRIFDHDLYETLGNNPCLPDQIKQVMLLKPGVQGTSPIVGEYLDKAKCHIWEYLRANSYIPWGHFAANMAEDSIRYSVKNLDMDDITGLRHLYYQRIYITLASELGIPIKKQGLLSRHELEEIRCEIQSALDKRGYEDLRFSSTLWGWNYGYDFSPSGFRLHASHQQIHQQFALIPDVVEAQDGGIHNRIPTYAIGDMVASFIEQFKQQYKTNFFDAYIKAILTNNRTDGLDEPEQGLSIFRDENVMLFVPKAQRFHGELHILCLEKVGNIIEANNAVRKSLDKAIYLAVNILDRLGARMITSFELSKRFGVNIDQRLMYCLIPKHPQSPGAFSEQQARWITGHFPEDFARSCRQIVRELPEIPRLDD